MPVHLETLEIKQSEIDRAAQTHGPGGGERFTAFKLVQFANHLGLRGYNAKSFAWEDNYRGRKYHLTCDEGKPFDVVAACGGHLSIFRRALRAAFGCLVPELLGTTFDDTIKLGCRIRYRRPTWLRKSGKSLTVAPN